AAEAPGIATAPYWPGLFAFIVWHQMSSVGPRASDRRSTRNATVLASAIRTFPPRSLARTTDEHTVRQTSLLASSIFHVARLGRVRRGAGGLHQLGGHHIPGCHGRGGHPSRTGVVDVGVGYRHGRELHRLVAVLS